MSDVEAAREGVAAGCRVLAARGLSDGVLGHISLRMSSGDVLVRCRGPRERGLAFTEAADIRLVTLDGEPAAGGELDRYSVPNEFPLHAEVLRSRADVQAVVHAHPPAIVAAELAGLRLRPILGAFDIPGAHLARGGIPVFARGVLIRSRILATEMVEVLGSRPAVILRGHGVTTTGVDVPSAVLTAISIDRLAQMHLAVAAAGGVPETIPDEDFAELPDLGQAFNSATAWRHELARIGDVTA